MSWYTAGTVNLTNSSKTVTGVGTKWTNPLIGVCAGQMLILKTANTIEIYEIASVQSDTQLTLANQYSGATKTGVSYEIPTVPKVSIEALALRISEMLNYYQQQMDGWQSILTGEGEVTLTAPDGKIVTIKSQTAISNELIKLVDDSKSFSESAGQSATNANNSAQSALSSATSAQNSADNANNSATSASQSATSASNSAVSAQESENNSKTSETNAAQSATAAKNAVDSIDASNFIKKAGEENQSISGSLDVDELKEKGVRVYSPNNKPSADDIGVLAATKTVVNDKTEYQTDNLLNFKVKPKFNNSDLIAKSDFSMKIGNPGFEIMPSGLIRQWGTVTLAPIGNYNAAKVDSILYYTNYYRILLPIAFPTCADSVNVILNCRAFNEQWSMFGLSATASLDGSPTMFTVAVLSSTLGFIPKISYEIIGH